MCTRQELRDHELSSDEETVLLLMLHANDIPLTDTLITLVARGLFDAEGKMTQEGRKVAKMLNYKRLYGNGN